MFMNDGEIITSYKQAADKSKQVGVLAELNAVSRSEMEIHLEGLGLLKRKQSAPAPLRSKPVLDEPRTMELLKQGKSDLEIAEILGVSVKKVSEWRRQSGLLRPRGGSKPGVKRKKTQEAEEKPASPAPEPLPDAARCSGSITVSCLLQTLSEMAEKFPNALVFFGDRQTPTIVRMSVLYEPGHPAEAEIYLMEGEAPAEQKGR